MAEQQGTVTPEMLTVQAQTFAKLWALLTSEQKAEIDDSIHDDIGEFLSNAPAPLPPTLSSQPAAGAPN